MEKVLLLFPLVWITEKKKIMLYWCFEEWYEDVDKIKFEEDFIYKYINSVRMLMNEKLIFAMLSKFMLADAL